MRVSVIMATYNRLAVLPRAIDSVLRQTHRDFELLVVDDGSSDGTREYLAGISDPRVRVVAQPNRGLSAARNAGLAQITGELVSYLDSDNVWHADYLSAVVSEMADATVAAYTGRNLLLVGGTGQINNVIGRKTRSEPFNPVSLLSANYIDINCFSHRQRLVEDLGGFDTAISWAEDWDFITRVAIRYPFQIRHIDQVLCDHYFYLPDVLPTLSNSSAGYASMIRSYFGLENPRKRDDVVVDRIQQRLTAALR